MASTLMGMLDPLLGKLPVLLERDYARLKGAHHQIVSLRDELSSMKAVLEELSQLEEPALQVKEWMHQLRELSYDIEDCVDLLVHQLAQADACDGFLGKVVGWLKKLQVSRCAAGQIAELKERAVEVNDRRKRLKIDVATSSSTAVAIDPRLPALFEADRLVGIDGPRDELIGWLTDGDSSAKQRRVLSIVGIGGLGKTTLANQVYQQIKDRFDCTAFVSVSRNPNISKILARIFHGVGGRDTPIDDQMSDVQQLINMIRDHLKDYRYFIMIDDIWSISAWQIIQCAFPENNRASRIMTTTRIEDIAKSCYFSHEDYVYAMKPLSKADSKRLFFKRVFGFEDKCSSELKEIADEILKKCSGLPLAIVNISSLVASKPTSKQEWERVQTSISSTLEQGQELETITKILVLSYYDLPHHLKICLLYLSIFPEDFQIDRERLIWKWIAQGFIVEQGGQSLEEVGGKYFNELINRNMIQPLNIDYSGTAKACRMHDIMLDLLISLSNEENFATILHDQKFTSSPTKIRRLSVQNNSKEHAIFPGNCSFSHIRSLSIFGYLKELPPLFDFQVLRVLDLEECYNLGDDHMHIEDIGSLSQLRYVSFRNISKIPKQIGKLQLLQTLDLSETRVKELPSTIVELHQLVRLFLPVGVKLPNGIGGMETLQELSLFDGRRNTTQVLLELGNLINLKVLHIKFWDGAGAFGDYQKSLVSSLCKLGECNLRSLHITSLQEYSLDFLVDSWCPPPRRLQIFSMIGVSYFPRFPNWMSSLSDLTCLRINLEQVGEKDVQLLKDLPNYIQERVPSTHHQLQWIPMSKGVPFVSIFALEHQKGWIGSDV